MKRMLATACAAVLAASGSAAAQSGYAYDSYDRYSDPYDARYQDRYYDDDRYDAYDRYDRYPRDYDYDFAEVLRVDPLVHTRREPIRRSECWDEPVLVRDPVYARRDRDVAPAVLGAIVGGVLGNQFGSGHGRDATTLAGAALGYAAVRDSQRDRHGYYGDRVYRTHVERCAVRTDWRRDADVVAYDVTYRYNGQVYRTRTSYHPGDTIRVRVDVDAIP